MYKFVVLISVLSNSPICYETGLKLFGWPVAVFSKDGDSSKA